MKKINVLSHYDGISAGQVALLLNGFEIDNYIATEIDKYAISVTQKNFPNTTQLGNIFDVDYSKLPKIDLVIGGSPCTNWSIAKRNREITSEGIGYELFMQYVKGIRETNPKYFFYENNFSIHKDIKEAISAELGVQPITVNSSLVSAQNRKRCYWTNIPVIGLPEDLKIKLKDVLESGEVDRDKSYCIDASYYKDGNLKSYFEKCRRQQIFEPVLIPLTNSGDEKEKSNTIRVGGKGSGLTDKHNWDTIRLGHIGKGGQGERIYSVEGKSVSLVANAGGLGAKTGLYEVNLPDGNFIIRKLTPLECERLQTFPDGFTEYGVDKTGNIVKISNTQRYKLLGNSWTVNVPAWFFSFIKKDF